MFSDMKTAFIIPTALAQSLDSTSALQQCLDSIKSIQQLPAQSGIGIVNYADRAMTGDTQNSLLEHSSFIANYHRDTQITELTESLPSESILALSHIAALTWFFSVCLNQNIFAGPTRIIMLELGINITTDLFTQLINSPTDKFIFAPPLSSSLSSEQTGGIAMQLNTQLWSFTSEQLEKVVQLLEKSVHYAYDRLKQQGSVNLAHTLFKFIDSSDTYFLKQLNTAV